MVQFILILDNIRSGNNVGSILRTCDALGIRRVLACGITPYSTQIGDSRPPEIANRNSREIAKTALGAEKNVTLEHTASTLDAVSKLKQKGRHVYALEQSPGSTSLFKFEPQLPSALVVGNEIDGVSHIVLKACDDIIEIPQRGAKESLNVAVATGIALYQLLGRV